MKNRVFLFFLSLLVSGCSKTEHEVKRPAPPKLIVFICIDQFRYDYLNRFLPYFAENGFKYLLKNGASFIHCEYGQATTKTSVGHSVMMSGTYPRVSGIVANNWYDRDLQRLTYSVEDTTAPVLDMDQKSNADGRSPRKFNGTNLGSVLKLHTGNKAKVFGVSCKDDASILMAGPSADAAYWRIYGANDSQGGFFTSSYYMKGCPEWVTAFNQERRFDRWVGKKWDLLLDEKNYPAIDSTDMKHYDYPKGWSGTLPYTIGINTEKPDADYYRLLLESPFSSEALLDFAERLTVEEKLGVDDIPDILCISFSANDEIGHSFGPLSREVMDVTVRTDRYLSRLFKFVNKLVGDQNVLYVLTADHGVAPIPDGTRERGIDAGRVKPVDIERLVQESMTRKYGPLTAERSYVGRMANLDFYFNGRALDEKKIDKKDAEDYISQVLTNSFPQVFRIFKAYDLIHGNVSKDKISESVEKSYYERNSGDLVIVLKPDYVWDKNDSGAEHGLPYSYDKHVPLLFCGKNWIKSGTYGRDCSPADIAPTLSAVLGIDNPSGAEGQILKEAIRFLK